MANGQIEREPTGLRRAAREVAAALYAQSIWRTGDMTGAGSDVEHKLVERVYRDGIPAAAAAAWLKISTRWLRKLANRVPNRVDPASVHEVYIARLLRDAPSRWIAASDMVAMLAEQGVESSSAEVLDVLERLAKVGQAIEERRGHQHRFRAAEAVRICRATDIETRKKAVMSRAKAIPEVIEQYLGDVPGSAFSIYRYSIPEGREQQVAEELREAVSAVLRKHTVEVEESEGAIKGRPVTYLMAGGTGWLGTPGRLEDEV